jgi:hypothetical protein
MGRGRAKTATGKQKGAKKAESESDASRASDPEESDDGAAAARPASKKRGREAGKIETSSRSQVRHLG